MFFGELMICRQLMSRYGRDTRTVREPFEFQVVGCFFGPRRVRPYTKRTAARTKMGWRNRDR